MPHGEPFPTLRARIPQAQLSRLDALTLGRPGHRSLIVRQALELALPILERRAAKEKPR